MARANLGDNSEFRSGTLEGLLVEVASLLKVVENDPVTTSSGKGLLRITWDTTGKTATVIFTVPVRNSVAPDGSLTLVVEEYLTRSS